MRKLKLDLNDLKVESFETTARSSDSDKGTVHGLADTRNRISCLAPCEDEFTCATCGNSCHGSCSCGITCSNTCGSGCGNSPFLRECN